jgi:DNA-binding NtrC family response regulator
VVRGDLHCGSIEHQQILFDHKHATRIEAPWIKRGQVMESGSSVPKLAEVEREHILKTLARCNGNRTSTANLLGISIRGLRIKLHEYQRAGFAISAPNERRDIVAARHARSPETTPNN